MQTPQKKEEEKNVKFDFIKSEIEYILANANFTEDQEKVFNLLTGKRGRESVVYIAEKLNTSESTVCRRIKEIKSKIKRLP